LDGYGVGPQKPVCFSENQPGSEEWRSQFVKLIEALLVRSIVTNEKGDERACVEECA